MLKRLLSTALLLMVFLPSQVFAQVGCDSESSIDNFQMASLAGGKKGTEVVKKLFLEGQCWKVEITNPESVTVVKPGVLQTAFVEHEGKRFWTKTSSLWH